jgi:AraC family transcriptional regulator of adaptative response/methylated-DNA-[protein]-cysteine methyltransferase
MYNALVRRDRGFEGVFFVGVKTTGIFCRPTCTARKPRPENVEYFPTTVSALSAGYRACKRCHPLDAPQSPPAWLTSLRDAVDRTPGLRLRDADLRARKLEPATTRRLFKKHFGMTFQAYARARRVGAALGTIRSRSSTMTELQTAAGYESESGFREACEKLLGEPVKNGKPLTILPARWITTPLGPMLALADDEGLRLLEFIDRRGLERQLQRIRRSMHAAIVPGEHAHLDATERWLQTYFDGRAPRNDLKLAPRGSDFQKKAWDALLQIPLGQARSYAQQAAAIGRPTATRAVARANGDNVIAIIIPCHRVIGSDGSPTGYGGGLWRKVWLLEHEQKVVGGLLPHTTSTSPAPAPAASTPSPAPATAAARRSAPVARPTVARTGGARPSVGRTAIG